MSQKNAEGSLLAVDSLPAGLLALAKNYLDITWDDAATDAKLGGVLLRGIKYLNNTAGAQLSFEVEDKPLELLLDYARYARSNALDEFQNNYLSELLTLQNNTALGLYEVISDDQETSETTSP